MQLVLVYKEFDSRMTYSPDDYYNDPIMDAVFESFFDMKTEDHSWNSTVNTLGPLAGRRSPKVQKKRKSLDWDSKPLEKRRDSGQKPVRRPVKSASASMLGSRSNETLSFEQPGGHSDLYIDAPFDFDSLPFDHELVRPSGESIDDSLDMFSSLFLEPKLQGSAQCLEQTESGDASTTWKTNDISEDELAKKRSKWSDDELRKLWEGISKHGNNWTDIMGEVTTRSYCQIKDKGRRCLFLLGWKTGRSKVETDSSSLHAKRIANQILANWEL